MFYSLVVRKVYILIKITKIIKIIIIMEVLMITKKYMLDLPKTLHKKVKNLANDEDKTINYFIIELLKKRVENENN